MGSKKTILVVDDFESIRNFICETLHKKGYDTIGARDGNDAFNKLLQNSKGIHLVLSDYHMPDCSGFELLKKIKTTPQMTHVPVVFLTSESSDEKRRSAMEAGLSAWIKKPYQAEFFFEQIENAING